MQDKKMTNPTDGINESNKKLRAIYEKLCCILGVIPAKPSLQFYRRISTSGTNAAVAKSSAGDIYTLVATNTNAAVRYLKLYNMATAPVVGTDIPLATIAIPGNTSGAGIVIPFSGLNFSNGIAMALTTGATDADTGAVAANEIIVQFTYE